MPRTIDLDAIEDLAERDGPQAALRAIGEPEADEASSTTLLRGALLARSGELEAALEALDGLMGGGDAVSLEAAVTRASVLAAQGRYGQAVPALKAALARLQRAGGPAWLLRDATAELAAYETLLG